MNQRILTAVAAIVAIVGGFFILKNLAGGAGGHGDNNANFPDGFYYICGKDACKVEFNVTVKALDDVKLKDPLALPACPRCGDAHPTRAIFCKPCGKYSPLRREDPRCGHCGK